MMLCEFLDRTGFTEKFITPDRYKAIEAAYMDAQDENKDAFCKRFYKEYKKAVIKPVDMLLKAKTTAENLDYINGLTDFADVEQVHGALMDAFCKTFR